ncbi:hypothetical protein SDC9_157483 [bioreactor metagenome]|uniref:HD domain-containing protein n=1 Tax=bioreactor metagenome TaxID=1076179 RepID=A0A645F740_9ZZZZ
MLTRIRQGLAAWTARITPEDHIFVENHLNAKEQGLFWRMNLPDQRHALNVAYTSKQLAAHQAGINQNLLLRCALLHDVGKVYGDVSTLDKIITVMAHKLAPQWAKQWGREGRGGKIRNLRHAFYIYFHHPARSASFLQAIGASPAEVEIIARHHKAPAKNDPPELGILREADNLH